MSPRPSANRSLRSAYAVPLSKLDPTPDDPKLYTVFPLRYTKLIPLDRNTSPRLLFGIEVAAAAVRIEKL